MIAIKTVNNVHDNLRHYFEQKRHYTGQVLGAFYTNKAEYDHAAENSLHLINLESTLLGVLSYSRFSEQDIAGAIYSAQCILDSLNKDREAYRVFLIDMAKRAVSDIYYLFLLYTRFYLGAELTSDTLDLALKDIMRRLAEYDTIVSINKILRKYKKHSDSLFFTSNQKIPWEYDDSRIRDFYSKNQGDQILSSVVMSKILGKALTLKKKLKKDYRFLAQYYNNETGKSYRYQFIVDSMQEKVESNKVSSEVFASFQKLNSAYTCMFASFVRNGHLKFGVEMSLDYFDVLEFAYKASKLIEYKYLRTSRYEMLSNFRTDVLLPLEREIISSAVKS